MTKPRTIANRSVIASLVWAVSAAAAIAQSSPRPFSVGGGEGGGGADGGITGWLLSEQSRLTHLMSAKVHALHADPSAAWGLITLGLAYGVFHAAGPGHGKAVIASYMLANERSLKRGAALALLAALLQATVAIVLVGSAGLVFNATASEMNRAASWLELLSYSGVAAIGLWLVWRKGGALVAALRGHLERGQALASAPAYAGVAWSAAALTLPSAGFRAGPPGAAALRPDECGHVHAPDPAALDRAFSWRGAVGTVIAAGVRVRARSSCWCSRWPRGSSRRGSPRPSPWRSARRSPRGRSPRWPYSQSRPPCVSQLAKIRASRWWRGASNSPPRLRCWPSASPSWLGRAGRHD